MKKPVWVLAVIYAVSNCCFAQSTDLQYTKLNSVIGLGSAGQPWSDAPSDTKAVTLYGLIDLAVVQQQGAATGNGRETGSSTTLGAGYMQADRVGIKGSEALGNGLTAFFAVENGFNANNGAYTESGVLFSREAVVGLNSPWGVVQFGRRKDYMDDESAAYSNVIDFGFLINNAHANDLDRTSGIWTSNTIRYDSPAVVGVSVSLMAAPGGNAGNTAEGSSYEFGLRYAPANLPFSIGIAYFESYSVAPGAASSEDYGLGQGKYLNQACSSGPVGVPCNKVIAVGAKYLINPSWLVHALWTRVEQPLAAQEGSLVTNFGKSFVGTDAYTSGGSNTASADIVDCGIDHFVGRWKLSAGAVQSRNNFVGGPNPGKLLELLAGVDYGFSKRTDAYLDYGRMTASAMYNPGIGEGGSPGVDRNAQAIMLGLRHLF